MGTRSLEAHSKAVQIPAELADELLAAGLVYECGDVHDLHLNPGEDWPYQYVEKLVRALAP